MTISIGGKGIGHTSASGTTCNGPDTGTINTQTTGSTFVVHVGWYNGGSATPAVSDKVGGVSTGNSYTQVGSTVSLSGDTLFHTAMFECVAGAGGNTHTWTITFTGGTPALISTFFREVVGGDTSNPRDQHVASEDNHSAATPYVSQNVTTTQASEALVACTWTYTSIGSGNETLTWGNSFTADAQQPDSADFTGGAASRIVSSTGTYQSSVTSSGSANASTAICYLTTYKEAGAGGGSITIPTYSSYVTA